MMPPVPPPPLGPVQLFRAIRATARMADDQATAADRARIAGHRARAAAHAEVAQDAATALVSLVRRADPHFDEIDTLMQRLHGG